MRSTIRGAILTLTLAGAWLASAQMPGGMASMFSPESMEYMNHKLDISSVDLAFVANTNLREVVKTNPALTDEIKLKMGPGAGKLPTLDEMASKIRAHPEAVAAIERSGLDVEDFLTTNFSLVYGWMMHNMNKRGMLDQVLKIAPTMKRSVNLDFIAANEARIQQYIDAMQQLGNK